MIKKKISKKANGKNEMDRLFESEIEDNTNVDLEEETNDNPVDDEFEEESTDELIDDIDDDTEVSQDEEAEDEQDVDNNEWDEEEDDDDDLFLLDDPKRKAVIDEGEYPAQVGKLSAQRTVGKYGEYIKVGIPFKIKDPKTGKIVEVGFYANKNMHIKSKLYPIVKGILGRQPEKKYDIRKLQGTKVIVTIEHSTDDKGNVWEDVVFVRKLNR